MNKIKNYKELLAEKQRLTLQLQEHRRLIEQDVDQLKVQVQPLVKSVSFAGKLFSRDKQQNLLGAGLGLSVEMLFRRLLRSNWLAGLVVPFLAHNVSSHITSTGKKTNWLGKLKNLFSTRKKSTVKK